MAHKKPEVEPTPVRVEAADDSRKMLREAAIAAVHNQHGLYANRLKNYDELVSDAMRQITGSIEANKTF